MTFGQKLRKQSASAREQLAEAEFSEKVVLEACSLRALEGFTWCEIRPSRPIDVKKTAAVAETVAALSKQQMRCEWEPFRERPDTPPYPVLRISWEGPER